MQAVRYPGISMIIGQLGATRTAGPHSVYNCAYEGYHSM